VGGCVGMYVGGWVRGYVCGWVCMYVRGLWVGVSAAPRCAQAASAITGCMFVYVCEFYVHCVSILFRIQGDLLGRWWSFCCFQKHAHYYYYQMCVSWFVIHYFDLIDDRVWCG